MADVRAVKNGNWSDTTVWNTGALPTTADDVYSNTFTVNVDTSFQVLSLRSTSGTGITAGGTFNFNSGSVSGSCTRTADNTSLVAGATNLITVTAISGLVSLTLGSIVTSPAIASTNLITHTGACNFNLTGITFRSNQSYLNIGSIVCINKSSTGTITITGNVEGGITNLGSGIFGLNSSAGNTIIIGNVTSNGGNYVASTFAAVNQSAGNLTVTGNVAANSTSGASTTDCGIIFSGTGNLIITGNVTGGLSGNNCQGIITSTTGITTINGRIIGGSSPAIASSAIGTINVSGSVVGGSTNAVSLSGALLLNVNGPVSASNTAPAVLSTNASATNIFTGPFINTNNTMAVQCVDMVLTADASTFWNFGDITLFSPERLAFYPSASDIRQGTTYADGTVSGSLAMPPPTAVIAGTPTDNTTGSAVLTAAQLQDAVWGRDLAQMTETGSIGYRLAKSATTDSTGKQIASYLI